MLTNLLMMSQLLKKLRLKPQLLRHQLLRLLRQKLPQQKRKLHHLPQRKRRKSQ